MKIRISIFLLFSFIITKLYSQDILTIPIDINWMGVEKVYTDTFSHQVIAFTNAVYMDNNLPYYKYKLEKHPDYSYTYSIDNLEFVNISEDELDLIQDINFYEKIEIDHFIADYRGKKELHISVLPFIEKNGEILKLKNGTLHIEKTKNNALPSATSRINHANSSILANGTFFKIKIKDTGIYRITYDELRAKGIEPTNVRIFGYGGGVLEEDFSKQYWDDLPEIPVFDTGNQIIFYGQGINKIWHENDSFHHKINSYANYGYYFITSSNVGEKNRISKRNETNASSYNEVNIFTDYQVHEKEVYNLIKSGKEFYGERFNYQSRNTNINFNFPNLITSSPIIAKIDVGAIASTTSNFTLSLNNVSNTLTVARIDSNYKARSSNSSYNYSASNDNLVFNIAFTNSSNSAEGYLNYLAVTAKRQLTMNGSYMIFHNTENIGNNSFNKYSLVANNSNIQIWEIPDPINIKQISTQITANSISFIDTAHIVKTYIAVDPYATSGFLSVESFEQVSNQNIHGLGSTDMLIITHPLFIEQAYRLAQAHYDHDGLRVEVVTTEQVYNEFSSGTPDATAYRKAAKMFYDKPQKEDDKLKYLLLFGKGSYDNRGIISASGYNYVLTYQADDSFHEVNSFVTDDYFGLLGDEEGKNIASELMDIGIGRFPVTTVQQAENVVTKNINYMKNENKGGWKNQLCFIGDDGGDRMNHIKMLDPVIDNISKNYQPNKIYLDAYQQEVNANGESYPAAKNRIHNLINSGVFLVNYMGHAGPHNWANEQILNTNEIISLTNTNLPLFTTGSCNFSLFDQQYYSGGEELLLNANGGGIGTFAAARTVFKDKNEDLIAQLINNLFPNGDEEPLRIGDIIKLAKNNRNGDTNKLNYLYLGNPAIKLNYAHPYKVEVISVNEKPISETDTLKALSVATITGIITAKNGEKDENFNGYLKVISYDKEQEITTLDNHKEDIAYTYKDRTNIIYNGKTKVENGEFSFTFMLPKDIRYNYGTGRFNFYAWDDENDKEGQGYFEDFIVGGSNDNYEYEEDGPETVIYLNYPEFISGSRVNDTILFVANIYDINGINTSGSTGHDISLCITQDGMEKFRFILNDYFEADEGSYQSGTITFMMTEIPEGKYSLSFKVWDLLNNSTTRALDFEVVNGLPPTVYSVINYPNPASTHTYFEVKHTRENQKVDLTIDIFDLSGRKIWNFTEKETGVIYWDLTGGHGNRVQPGIYIYRASTQFSGKISSSESNKIIITKQ